MQWDATTQRVSSSLAGIFAGAFDFLLWSLLLLATMTIVPKFTEIFTDFGVQLPWLSTAVPDIAAWLGGGRPGQAVPGIFWAMLLLLAVCAGMAVLFRSRTFRSLAWVLFMLWTLLPFLALVLLMLAMYVPMAQMIDSLQKGNP